MSKAPFLKLQSSKSLEELLSDTTAPHHQNWLLSYLDVFVLIVMLIITLISLGDMQIEEDTSKPTASKVKEGKPTVRPLGQKLRPAPAPVIQLESITPQTESKPFPVQPTTPTDSAVIPTLPLPPPAPVETDLTGNVPNEAETTTANLPGPQQSNSTPIKREVLKNSLTDTLGRLGLDKTVAITITEDYAQLEIQDKILFESSQANLTTPGEELLRTLAPVLKQASGLIFIEGHTDNRPINTSQFPSNWELGSTRATRVLHYLTTQELDSSRMRAVTYADTMPIADNSTAEGREKNRRVSILIKVQEQDTTP